METSWLEPDATDIAVGSDGPDKQELAAEAVAKADKIVADRFLHAFVWERSTTRSRRVSSKRMPFTPTSARYCSDARRVVRERADRL